MAETPRWHERGGNTLFLQFGISSTKARCAPNPPWARTLGQSANGRPRPAHEHPFSPRHTSRYRRRSRTLTIPEVGTVLHDTLKAIHLPFAFSTSLAAMLPNEA